MRKTFIKMALNLADLTPIHDTFHRVIPGMGDNKSREMLTFEVRSFDIGYNCILGRQLP
jgi:hypothetical protein